MPIVAGAIVYGTLVVRSRSAVYDAADVEVLGAIAALAATAVRNIRLVDELRRSRRALAHQAFHDPLTGLANRTRFHDLLALALGGVHADHVAVVMIDLDGFKLVNDQLGHAAGDRLLAGVADRLLNATRGADTVSRLGGDEFAVLLENVHHIADAEVVAQRILKALRAPFDIEGVAMTVGASIGIARHSPLDNGNGDALLRRADLAMYDVKASGKGGYIVYNSPRERRLVVPKLTLSV
jgi:diguanylate cyclase (GGDEF)-like protein